LVYPEKDKLGMRPRFSTFALEEVFEALFLLPGPGHKWNVRQEMPRENNAGTKGADSRDDEWAMSG
jgi:hypothetical protein